MDALKPRCGSILHKRTLRPVGEKLEPEELNLAIATSEAGDKQLAIMYCADCGTIFSTQIIAQVVDKPRVELIQGGLA